MRSARYQRLVRAAFSCIAVTILAILPVRQSAIAAPFSEIEKRLVFVDHRGKPLDYRGYIDIKWSDVERKRILSILRNINQKAPGLLERATAYRPLQLYRIDSMADMEWASAAASGIPNVMYLTDYLFQKAVEPEVTATIIHELTHLADGARLLEIDPEWHHLIGSPVQQIQDAIEQAGLSLPMPLHSLKKVQEVAARFDPMARQQGLPNSYAAKDYAETLAVCVEASFKGWKPNKAIHAYLHSQLLGTPYAKEQALQLYNTALGKPISSKPEGPIDDLTQAIAIQPNFAMAYLIRGWVNAGLGNTAAAMEDYAQAITLSPTSSGLQIVAHLHRVDLYAKSRDTNAQVKELDAAVAVQPHNPTLYYKRGELFASMAGYIQPGTMYVRKSEMIEPAIADFTKVISEAPDYFEAYGKRANMYTLQKRYAEAETDLTSAINIESNTPRLKFDRAYVRLLAGKPQQAVDDLNGIAAAVQYWAPFIGLVRGEANLRAKNYREAIKDLDLSGPIAVLVHDRGRVMAWRGIAYTELGEFEKAIADLEIARNWSRTPMTQELLAEVEAALNKAKGIASQ